MPPTSTHHSPAAKALPPGTFKPAPPQDSQEVIRLFAIAARAVCAHPDGVEQVSYALSIALSKLVPPERLAAEECGRLWGVFARMVRKAKPDLIERGALALYRDLDAIGGKLGLPPLDRWSALPTGVDAPPAAGAQPARPETTDTGESLEAVRARAQAAADRGAQPPLAPELTLALITALNEAARQDLYKNLVGGGKLSRGDVALIEQVIERGEAVAAGDLVTEALATVAVWLAG
jgi:hypothetical protein